MALSQIPPEFSTKGNQGPGWAAAAVKVKMCESKYALLDASIQDQMHASLLHRRVIFSGFKKNRRRTPRLRGTRRRPLENRHMISLRGARVAHDLRPESCLRH